MSNRQPIMFLAGLWVPQYIWEWWASVLSANGYDANYHRYGENFGGFDRSLRRYIKDIIRRCYQIKEETGYFPIIFGHSMGGLVAQAVATRVPVPQVVLVCSAAPRGISNLTKPVIKRMASYIRPIILGDEFCPSDQHLRELVFNKCLYRLEGYAAGYSSGTLVRQAILGAVRVPKLSCPCLVVAGTEDRMLPRSIQERLAKKHDASIVIGPYGHMPMLEDNDDTLIKLIINWLSQHKEN